MLVKNPSFFRRTKWLREKEIYRAPSPSIKIYNNDMKKILLSLCLLLSSLLASAQYRNTSSEQSDEAKKQELRQQIGLDYSMPDYTIDKIDASVIGLRLAKILTRLLDNYESLLYNQMLAMIRSQVAEDPNLRYVHVDKLKLLNISKTGNKIIIRFNTFTKDKNRGKLDYDLEFAFVDGLSEDKTVNDLFSNIGRYIKDEE